MDIDVGTVVIRLALGGMLVTHGVNKVFGPGGLAGTTAWFGGLGLQPAHVHARLATVTEISAGLLMMIGLLTTPAAAAFIGLMTVATLTDHRGKGYFVFKGGSEYTILVATIAGALTSIGPGEWSIDHAIGWDLSGAWWAFAAVVVGICTALALLAVSFRPTPGE